MYKHRHIGRCFVLILAALGWFAAWLPAANLADVPLVAPVRGVGIAVANLDAKLTREAVFAWVEGTDTEATAKYRILFNLTPEGAGEALSEPVAIGPVGPAVAGADLTIGLLDDGTIPDLLFAWLTAGEKGSTISFRVGLNIAADAPPIWGETHSVENLAGAGARGLGVAFHDINGNGTKDLVLAWAKPQEELFVGRMVIAFDLGEDQTPAAWSQVYPVGAANLSLGSQVQGVGLVAGNFDVFGQTDVVFAWTNGEGYQFTSGVNLNRKTGKPAAWPCTNKVKTGTMGDSAIGAGRLHGPGPLDMVCVFTEAMERGTVAKIVCVPDPVLAQPYVPNAADYTHVGDPTTGFSRASVNILISQGLMSSAQLLQRIAPLIKDKSLKMDILQGIEKGLDNFQPPLPAKVRAELAHFLQKHYQVEEVGI